MPSVNKLILIGHAGKDPENYSGTVKFSVATTEKWKDNEHTEWHNIVCFGKLAEIAEQYVHKGALVYVEGSIRSNEYQDKVYKDVIANTVRVLSRMEGQMYRQPTNSRPSQDDLISVDPF